MYYADIGIGAVVGERHIGIGGEIEDVGFISGEFHVQVFGIRLGDAAAIADEAHWQFPFALGQDCPIRCLNRFSARLRSHLDLAGIEFAAAHKQRVKHAPVPLMPVGI